MTLENVLDFRCIIEIENGSVKRPKIRQRYLAESVACELCEKRNPEDNEISRAVRTLRIRSSSSSSLRASCVFRVGQGMGEYCMTTCSHHPRSIIDIHQSSRAYNRFSTAPSRLVRLRGYGLFYGLLRPPSKASVVVYFFLLTVGARRLVDPGGVARTVARRRIGNVASKRSSPP